MTNTELIRQEINRLQEAQLDKCRNFSSGYNEGIFAGLSMLERFIDSLQQEQPVLHGWVAREDKGRLLLFGEKPLRNGNYGWKSSSFCIELNSNIYPDLMWIDDPIEVELSINKI